MNFDDSKKLSFTQQFARYRVQHPKSTLTTVQLFAANIIANPSHYSSLLVNQAQAFHLRGGKLNAKEIKFLVDASYAPGTQDLADFDVDHALSKDTAKVYKRKGDSKQAVVVHRGTQGLGDVALDGLALLGHDISKSKRVRKAKAVQQAAESKYGAENVSTVGHSLGAKIASDVGRESHEIIGVNKFVAPNDVFKTVPKNETNIRTRYDPASALAALQRNTFTIPSVSLHPFQEHSTAVLDRVDPSLQFGV